MKTAVVLFTLSFTSVMACASNATLVHTQRSALEHAREADAARLDVDRMLANQSPVNAPATQTFPLSQKEMNWVTHSSAFQAGISFQKWLKNLHHLATGWSHHEIRKVTHKMLTPSTPIDQRMGMLSANDKTVYYWMISLFANLKYGSEMHTMLGDLVSLQTLQTVRDVEWSQPAVTNPSLSDPSFKQNHPFQYAQIVIQNFAKNAGLVSYNATQPGQFVCPNDGTANPSRPDCSHKVFIVELTGQAANAQHPLGLYVHVDVVPVGSAWQLTDDNGKPVKNLDPFTMSFMKATDLGRDGDRNDYKKQYNDAMKQYIAGGSKDQVLLRWVRYLERRINDLEGSRYYGRGTIDDKGQVVSALYAFKTIRELQAGTSAQAYLPLLAKPIHLIVETSEETTTEGIGVYLQWAQGRGITSTSEVNLGLDANYPACIAENGIYRERALFAAQSSDPVATQLSGNQVMVDNLHGAEDPANQAHNNIPGLMKITFVGPGITALKAKLADSTFMTAFESYLQAKWKIEDPVKSQLLSEGETVAHLWHPLNPSTEISGNQLIVRLNGYERVSFKPMDSDSALVRGAGLFEYINAQMAAGTSFGFSIVPNAYTRLTHFVWDNFGFDYYGTKLGLAFYDRFNLAGSVVDTTTDPSQSFMGPLTAVPTMIDLPQSPTDPVAVYVDMRVPRANTKSATDQTELAATFATFGASAHTTLLNISSNYSFTLAATPAFFRSPRYVAPTQSWMQSLIGLFQQYTGRTEWGFIAIGGSTTAAAALNGINFGPTQPFENDVYHVPNEFKKIDDFHRDLAMFTNVFLDLASEQPAAAR